MGTVAEFATTGSMQQDQIAQRGAWAPPLPVYAGPQETARIAAANGVILAREPLAPRNGRVEVLLPDGRRGWVASAQLVPWHSVSKPDLRCHAALLENGHYGWFTG